MIENLKTYAFNADRPLESYKKSDPGFLIATILLWGLGMFTLVICSQNYASRLYGKPFYFVTRQLISSAIGLVGFLAFCFVDIKIIRDKFLAPMCLSILLLCILTFVPGISETRNGAARWVKPFGGMTLQPSELAKFGICLFLGNLFEKKQKALNDDDVTMAPGAFGLVLVTVIIFAQKDMSTGLFVFVLGVVMFIVAGMRLMWLIPTLIAGGIALTIMIFSEEYRIQRILGWLHKDEAALGQGINYQSLNAERAISSGGLLGSGIGSDFVKLNSIPEVQSDYIFAGWTEAMGFAGVIIYIAVLVFFAWKGFSIAFKSKNRFASYAAFGCVFSIVFQSVINLGVVSGAFPTTGIPLPFFSLGGSSIMVTLAMCGFVLNASRCQDEEEELFEVDNKIKYTTVNIEDIYE